jgi:hypothetical protein
MAIVASYSMAVGEQRSIPYSATKADGSPFDATGYTLKLRMKATPDGGPPYLIDKTLTITTQLGAIGTIDMLTADTLAFTPDTYHFDVTAYSGAIEIPLTVGTFQLTPRVSR